jgi:chromosome segregation ATPase
MDNQEQQRINTATQQFTEALVTASRATSDRSVAVQKLGTQMTGYFFNSVMNNLRTQAEGTRQVRRQLADQQRRAQEATREFTQVSANTYMNLLDSISSFYQGGTTRAQRRAEEAERRTEEAESRAEQAERNAEEAQRRAAETERSIEEAQRRADRAEERVKEAERRAEEAERQAEQAQGQAEQAQGRAEQAERRVEEAERSSSEAEGQGDDDLPLADYDSLNIRQISERLDGFSVEEIGRLRDYEVRNKNRSTLVNRLDSRIESSSS